jgi:predicted transglutaminase-like cysteine proteinase
MCCKLAYLAVVTLSGLFSTLTALAGVVYEPVSDTTRLLTDEPFELVSVRAAEGVLADKWQLALAEINSDLTVLSDCRVRPAQCPSPAARLLTIVDRAHPYEALAKLAILNSGVNIALQRNIAQHGGRADPWPTALATFSAGRGMCMHFAIAKYTALLLAGWPANDLRLLIVWPDRADQPHMVLAARHNGRWYILDNLRSALLMDVKATNYLPLFVFDHRGARQLGPAEQAVPAPRYRDTRISAHVGRGISPQVAAP